MTGDVTYEVVRNEVHEAIWQLPGADQTRILIEMVRLRHLANQIQDPIEHENALTLVRGLRGLLTPPARLRPPPEHGTCIVPEPPSAP